MEITNVKVVRVTGVGNTIGYANIVIDNTIGIHGIRIIKLPNGNRFVAMPSKKGNKKDKEGRTVFHDIVFPVSTEAKAKLTTVILEAFDKLPVPEPEAIEQPAATSETSGEVYGL